MHCSNTAHLVIATRRRLDSARKNAHGDTKAPRQVSLDPIFHVLGFASLTPSSRYGPVVRLSPNELAFNSAQAFTDIYGHRAGRLDLEKDPIHVGAVDPVPGVSTISMADRENHARQRKALSHGFSKKALWEQEAVIQGFVDMFIDRVHEFGQGNQVFDIVKWYNFLTFDIIGDLSFGESFGCLDRGEFHFWIGLIFDAVKAGAIEQSSRRFASPGTWLQKKIQSFYQGDLSKKRASHLAYSREKVMKYVAFLRAGLDGMY